MNDCRLRCPRGSFARACTSTRATIKTNAAVSYMVCINRKEADFTFPLSSSNLQLSLGISLWNEVLTECQLSRRCTLKTVKPEIYVCMYVAVDRISSRVRKHSRCRASMPSPPGGSCKAAQEVRELSEPKSIRKTLRTNGATRAFRTPKGQLRAQRSGR